MTRPKRGASHAGSWWSKPEVSGRRSANGQLHHPELFGPCFGKCPCSDRCGSLHNIRTENSPQPAHCRGPYGGAAHAYWPRADGSLLACLTALDRPCGTRDDFACGSGSRAAARPPALRVVVLRIGYRLHDDVFGSGDSLCPPDRYPAEPLV